jgi:hypothetical protein
MGGGWEEPIIMTCENQGMVNSLNEAEEHRKRRERVLSSLWAMVNLRCLQADAAMALRSKEFC